MMVMDPAALTLAPDNCIESLMTDPVEIRLDRIERALISLIHNLLIRQPAFLRHGLGDRLAATFAALARPDGHSETFAALVGPVGPSLGIQEAQENDEPAEVLRPLFTAAPPP